MCFAVENFGVSLKQAREMSLSEFQLRLSGFQSKQKWDMLMTREVSYQIYCLNFMLSKQKPWRKEKFWPIDKKKISIPEEFKDEFIRQKEAYLKKVDG